ncbi:hypothetical protein MOMA_01435 [Moraxella macacae 0408225]|uniref:Bestrophin n=1 Tax=Moraxella macacae 0408225 TaxID=1230338 RepID=L2F7Y9_9GAMM|nr:bestrophin family ion channel [Moraxella macacae]ELA09030.1 hypothetical protein MOMA_01435 [Moraxella macacae 0408225]
MIKRTIQPFKLLFIMQGSYFKRLIIPELVLFVFSFIIYYYQTHIAKIPIPITPTVFALLGISLAIFHGFCNNAAYDRFWEGRKLWGALVWQTRNVTRQVLTLQNIDMHEKQRFTRLVIAFTHSLRHQLRDEDNTDSLIRILNKDEQNQFVGQSFAALRLTQAMGEQLGRWLNQDKINALQWQNIDNSIGELAHIQAGCERIYNTPVPFSYFVLLHRTVYLYCFMLPFGLGNVIGWVTPFVVAFVGYTFMALNEIVDEISQPFGVLDNHLPLCMMCDTIETQLAQLSEQVFEKDNTRKVLPKHVIL